MKRIFYATLLAGALSGAPMVSEAGVTRKAADSGQFSEQSESGKKVSRHVNKHQSKSEKHAKRGHRQKHRMG